MPKYKTTSGSGFVPDAIDFNQLRTTLTESIRENLAKNLYPFGYHFPAARFVWNGIFGQKSSYRKQLEQDLLRRNDTTTKDRLALLSAYTQKDSGEKFEDYYSKSKYTPSLTLDNNSIYYTINDSDSFNRLNRLELLGMNSTVGYGKDSLWEYYSFYDLWDLSPYGESGSKDSSRGIGKPIELYDRFYNTHEDEKAYNKLKKVYEERKLEGNITTNGNTYSNNKVRATLKSGGKINNITMNYLDFFKKGGGIHIKKKNRGKFTKSAKAAGEGVQEHAHKVMNDPSATTLQKRRALFAINSKKWHHKKHKNGGTINYLKFFNK